MDVNAHILSVGNKLASSLSSLLSQVQGGPHGPKQLAGVLGVNKDVSHRLLGALRRRDPLAVVYQLPGPEPLRRVVKACIKNGVPREQTLAAEAAFRNSPSSSSRRAVIGRGSMRSSVRGCRRRGLDLRAAPSN